MKKLIALLLAMVMVISLAACGSSAPKAEAQKPAVSENVVLKIGTTASANGMPSRAAYFFQKRVEELSGGKITCEVNIAGTLGNTAQHYAQMKNGSLDIFVTAYDTFNVLENGKDFAICVVPYVFDDIDHLMKWTESDLYDEMIGKVEGTNGIKVLGPVGKLMPRGLSTTKVPVVSVADVENLKIRCPETQSMTEVWKAWGANPVIISAGELYTSLDSGICDGQENDVITTYNGAYYEIQPYYSELNYVQQAAVMVSSAKTWDKLTDEQKAWVEQAVKETLDGFSEELVGEYEAAKKSMEEGGVTFADVDIEDFRNTAAEAVKKMDGELFSAGLYEKIRALAG